MAVYKEPHFVVSLDDESKELLRALVKAVDRIAPDEVRDVSFGDKPKRLAEPVVRMLWDTSAPIVEEPIRNIEYGGHKYTLLEGEGEYLLHDDEHEGEDTE